MGLKEQLARVFEATGLNEALLRLQKTVFRPYARAVNYHDVPPARAGEFERQLQFYSRHFSSVGVAELRGLLAGTWSSPRPGLVLSFDDGLRSHADVVAPLLEKYGFTGWFMVPVGFVDTPREGQVSFATLHDIPCDTDAFEDQRIAMSWDDLRQLDARHVIACHTQSHRRLVASLAADDLIVEIAGAKRRLEEGLGHEVAVFGWVGGEEASYSAQAAQTIRDAGFELSFMTNNAMIRPGSDPLQLQRSNIEAHFPLELLRFTVSGFYDVMYLPKRWRVNQLTELGSSASS